MPSILDLCKKDRGFRQSLITKLAGNDRGRLPFVLHISKYDYEGELSVVRGKVVFPLMDWVVKFVVNIQTSGLENLYVDITGGSSLKEIKPNTFWWKFFIYLWEEGYLTE